jgi:4-hydroxy-3-methylbut-2-enyl diphosphate reductase
MIHNQEVNSDLLNRGIQFILDTDGTQFIPWEKIGKDDIVIIPAFGTTIEIEKLLRDTGVDIQRYNSTCPFVERVWNKAEKLGGEEHTIIIHGKPNHEETRATFSHSAGSGASIVVKEMSDAVLLGKYISGEKSLSDFGIDFKGKFSIGFNPEKDLLKVGVVNQTTMLATETQAIADYFREIMIKKYGIKNLKDHFADTRDTLCYATNDNQTSTYELLKVPADFAMVVGGYNSSNTSHIVELCERKHRTFFINSDQEIKSEIEIHHFDFHHQQIKTTLRYLPSKTPLNIILTSGASCPDTLVDKVLLKILSYFPKSKSAEEAINDFDSHYTSK